LTTLPPALQNFGRNQTIQPVAYYEPRTEAEVLELLNRHRGEQIRVIGRLHSWSAAPGGEGVVFNLKHFTQVECRDGGTAVIGAGSQIKHVLAELARHDRTLPSVGLITEQTLVGAAATGTHGSGRHSLSHYIQSVRIARYDHSGAATIEQMDAGAELQAARCSLGCLGIILSVTVPTRNRYAIEEFLREYKTLEEVLQAETEFPLQQFYFTPWRWRYLAQHRREVPSGRSSLAWLFRIYWFLSIDLGLHLLILATLRLLGSFRAPQFLFRRIIPHTVIHGWKVIDDSAAALVMEHELFRHVEMELFVRRSHLPQALGDLQNVLIVTGTTRDPGPLDLTDAEREQLATLRRTYGHHYPICVRRVLPDDTLVSMAEGSGDDWYAISLITYARGRKREGFYRAMDFLAGLMARKYGARPHWGKYCPLPPRSLVDLYPRFAEFRALCDEKDPEGRFRNAWLRQVFEASSPDAKPTSNP